jgi:hypothetical protein
MGEDEQTEQSGGFQGAVPLLASVAAGAAAGAIAVVARKALSGDGGDEGEGGGEASSASDREDGGTAFDDIDQVADDLAGLVDELRAQAEGEPDFRRLVELADAISEYADQAANAFEASTGSDEESESSERRVTDDLMSRIGELTGGEREKAGAGAGGKGEKESA